MSKFVCCITDVNVKPNFTVENLTLTQLNWTQRPSLVQLSSVFHCALGFTAGQLTETTYRPFVVRDQDSRHQTMTKTKTLNILSWDLRYRSWSRRDFSSLNNLTATRSLRFEPYLTWARIKSISRPRSLHSFSSLVFSSFRRSTSPNTDVKFSALTAICSCSPTTDR